MKNKYTYFLGACMLIMSSVSAQTPVITSFSPTSAMPFDTITVNGNNFSLTPSQNNVLFGAVQGNVFGPTTANQMKVVVPANASFGPISISVNGLYASSSAYFTPTFSCGGGINNNGFLKYVFNDGYSLLTKAGDLNGDGKPDLVTFTPSNTQINILQNNGSSLNWVDTLLLNNPVSDVAIADIDGDGKQDVIVATGTNNPSEGTLVIFRNVTAGLTTTFNNGYEIAAGFYQRRVSIAVSDIDNDGKIDIVAKDSSDFSNQTKAYLTIFKNNGTSGIINASTFLPKVSIPSIIGFSKVRIADLDGNGKSDVVLSVIHNDSNYVLIYPNTSSSGTINTSSFSTPVKIFAGIMNGLIYFPDIAIGDLNGDAKNDMITYDGNTNLNIIKNNCSVGTINNSSFDPIISLPNVMLNYTTIVTGDIDGDGKTDILVSALANLIVDVLLNVNTSGSLTDYQTYPISLSNAVGLQDMDGNSKPDILGWDGNNHQTILFNKMKHTLDMSSPFLNINCGDSTRLTLTEAFNNSTFSWLPANGLSNSSIANPMAKPITSTTYTITVNTGSGCPTLTDSVPVIVMLPTVSAGSNVNLVCSGQVSLNASTSLIGATYSWTPATGLNDPSIANPMAKPITSTTYTVAVSTGSGCPTVTDSISVIVMPPNVSAGSDVNLVCNGQVSLNASTSLIGATYSWTPATGLNNPTIANPICTSNVAMQYTVTASSGGCTNSDVVSANTLAPPAPSICIVTVDTLTGRNMIAWEKSAVSAIKTYNVYKETIVTGVYGKIATVPFASFSTLIDTSSRPAQLAARYKLVVVDSCDNESVQGSHHKTIHLNINKGFGNTWNLIWDHYEGFTFSTYMIFRGTTSGNMTYLTSIQNSLTSYTDVTAPAGDVYYVIGVVTTGNCNPSFKVNFDSHVFNSIGMSISNYAFFNKLLSLQNIAEAVNLEIIPNPSNGNVSINTNEASLKSISISVLDITGKLVFEKDADISSGQYPLDLTLLDKGLYFIRMQNKNTGGDLGMKKIIISETR